MAKQSGLGDNCWVGGYDLSGDIGMLDRVACPRGTLDVTGINKSAVERILTHKDGAIGYTAYFNPSAGQAHPVLSVLPTTDVQVIYCRGTTLGNPAACMIGKQLGYDQSRGADGSLTFKIQSVGNAYGLEWGRQATAGIRTDTAATNGSSIDDTAPSSYGLQAYLQVFALTGTDATIKIQQSSDNGVGDAFADVTGGGFTAVTTAPGTQRIATATNLAVERYLRVVTTTAAGFTSLRFGVVIVRNTLAAEVF